MQFAALLDEQAEPQPIPPGLLQRNAGKKRAKPTASERGANPNVSISSENALTNETKKPALTPWTPLLPTIPELRWLNVVSAVTLMLAGLLLVLLANFVAGHRLRTTTPPEPVLGVKAPRNDLASRVFTARELVAICKDNSHARSELEGKAVTVRDNVSRLHVDNPSRYIGFTFDASPDNTHGPHILIAMFRASGERPFSIGFLETVRGMRDGLVPTLVTVRGVFRTSSRETASSAFFLDDCTLVEAGW
jgi:hypothetical protein